MDQSYYYESINSEVSNECDDMYRYIQSLVDAIENKTILKNHEVLDMIKHNSIEPLILCKILSPLYHAVEFWTKHLQSYILLLNDPSTVNLANKIVSDNENLAPLFLNFLLLLGLKNTKPSITRPIRIFKNELKSILKQKGLGYTACLLAAIEYFCIDVMKTIVNYCHNNNLSEISRLTRLMKHRRRLSLYFIIAVRFDVSNEDIAHSTITGCIMISNMLRELVADYDYNKI